MITEDDQFFLHSWLLSLKTEPGLEICIAALSWGCRVTPIQDTEQKHTNKKRKQNPHHNKAIK